MLARLINPAHNPSYICTCTFTGSVMYETSPLEPGQVVAKLCHKHSSEAVHLGKYTVHGEQVSIINVHVFNTSGGLIVIRQNYV